MEKEFIPYEQALALKELGFDIKCIATITNYGYLHIKGTRGFPSGGGGMVDEHKIDCPTFSQAFRWFREKYELSCSIHLIDNSRHYYFEYTICDSKDRDYNDEDCFDSCKRIYDFERYNSYEDAELECLKKLIEITKNK